MKGTKTGWKVLGVLLTAAALSLGQTQTGPSQGPSPYTVAAPSSGPAAVLPGTINYIEGPVSLDNHPLGAAGPVVMQPVQALATGNGFAEVLLTSGAFLRLGPNSQFHLITAGLADTRLALDRGSAIVEVDQLIQGTNLSIAINGATAQLEKVGLYDFDANLQAVKVLNGKATVVEAAGSKSIEKGDQLLLAGAKPLKKSHFDTNAVKAQPLYVWSAARSQNEWQANLSLAQTVVTTGAWAGSGWYWDPYWSFYAYLPGDGFLYSPFGWGFYSPAFFGFYGGYYGGHYHYGHGVWNSRTGVNAHVSAARPAMGFHGGGFGGGFHGGGGGHR